MKDRPILFKPEMVEAILGGRKTQTRRVVKLPGDGWDMNLDSWWVDNATEFPEQYLHVPHGEGIEATVQRVFNPFGHPGDRLWVRERHKMFATFGIQNRAVVFPDGTWWERPTETVDASNPAYVAEVELPGQDVIDAAPWRPSIHMPKWACRLRLEITEIRVERVQGISRDDFMAEGGSRYQEESPRGFTIGGGWNPLSHKAPFAELWDSINGDGSGESNPWVWVVGFKAVSN